MDLLLKPCAAVAGTAAASPAKLGADHGFVRGQSNIFVFSMRCHKFAKWFAATVAATEGLQSDGGMG